MAEVKKVGFRWAVLGLSWVMWLLQGIAITSIGAMLPLLIEEFELAGWQAGALMAMAWVPGVVLAIPIGVLIDKYGGRRLSVIGLLMLGLGLIFFSYSNSFWALALARVLIGVGVVLCVSPPQAWTTKWFPPEELGTALGFLISGYSGAGVIGIFAMGYILSLLGWKMTALTIGIIAIIWMILVFAARRESPPTAGTASSNPSSQETLVDPPSLSEAVRNIELWKVGIAWFVIVGIFTAYATWAPTTLIKNLNMSEVQAAALAGIASITAVPFHIAGGWISDKFYAGI